MSRPYARLSVIFININDAMNMIWHDYKHIQDDAGEMVGNFQPCHFHDPANLI